MTPDGKTRRDLICDKLKEVGQIALEGNSHKEYADALYLTVAAMGKLSALLIVGSMKKEGYDSVIENLATMFKVTTAEEIEDYNQFEKKGI